MSSRTMITGAALLCAVALPGQVRAEGKPKGERDFVEQVRKAIEDGKKFLHNTQTVEDGTGKWEEPIESKGNPGGWTSMAVLALVYAGEKPNSPVIQRSLKYLRTVKPAHTYVVGLQTMVYAEVGDPADLQRIQDNVDWLIETRVGGGDNFKGWGYRRGSLSADNSNTQYALLGLHAGKTAGAKIPREVWESIQKFYVSTQTQEGSWSYVPGRNPSMTMTTAGLCGLLISGMELNAGREKFQQDGTATNCGIYTENEPAIKAMGWVGKHFDVKNQQMHQFYNLYGIERAGRLSGQRFFGRRDWYREGCEYLVDTQRDDGSWYLRGQGWDRWPIVSTSFALLFLSKGRTPVLISKLVHGPQGNESTDWNNDRNDARHLAEYVSKELFKKTPLAWQVFNARDSGLEDPDELAAELLQSPIAYFNGHRRPIFTEREKKMLKKYIDQGGFVLIEACCGQKEFANGAKALMKELFKEDGLELKPLRDTHPVWTAYYKITPSDRYPLWGVELGCKTVVIFSEKDLSCRWEENQPKAGGAEAFRIGANIVAYATGMELPKPKGFKVEVPREGPETSVQRGYLKVAQLKFNNDRHSTIGVTRNLMVYLRDKARMDVTLQPQELHPDEKDLLNYKFMYMHGRGEFDIDSVDYLRANLKTGGLLFADACCGKPAFDASFRKFVKKLFPDKELQPIPVKDELYGKDLNGTAITSVRCRQAGKDGYQEVDPYLEGIQIDGRWVVIYSKYDIGCALEKHQSSDCLGHDHASALRLAAAVVLYALQK